MYFHKNIEKSVFTTFSMLVFMAIQFVYTGALAAPPGNDDFDAATVVVEPLPFGDTLDTRDATMASDDPFCAGRSRTVWYTYTPSSDGPIESNTFGSSYDTTLSVYTGTRGSLTQIACNDDNSGLQSKVIWDGLAGTSYSLMVGSFGAGPGGDLNFEVKQGPVPVSVAVDVESALVTPSNGEATVAFAIEFSQPVFVFDMDTQLLQRSGRGAIFDSMNKDILDTAETIDLEWIFTDMFGSKGYAGGPAEFCVTVGFEDPVFGFIEEEICPDFKLQGAKGK